MITLLIAGTLTWATVKPAHAIVNGDIINDTSYSYVGLLSQPTEECTATLIDPNWALTAGHCINRFETEQRMSPSEVELRFNFYRRDNSFRPIGGEVRRAAAFQYANQSLALVRLDAPVNDIKPVRVATEEDQKNEVKTGFDLTAVGWGNIRANAHKPNESISSRELRAGLTHIEDSQVGRLNILAAGLIKTGVNEHAEAWASFGDSGGPLLSYKDGDIQVGIAANGWNLPLYGHYGSYYLPTGQKQVRSWISSECACLGDG